MEFEEKELLSRVSWAYYVNGMTQSEVADWLGLNRVRVNRLLQAAREDGLVQIMVNTDRASCYGLEKQLESGYRIRKALVVPEPPQDGDLNRNIGHAAAHYLAGALQDGDSLGLGWGTTVAAAAAAMPRQPADKLSVVSLYGGLPHSVTLNPYEIVVNFSRQLQAEHTYYIAAPMFAPSPSACRTLKSHELYRYVSAKAVEVDIALIGLGELSPYATNVALGAITQEEAESLLALGAVGEVFGAFVDENGLPVDHPLNERFMGPNLSEMRSVPRRIVAAGGEKKKRIIRAALAGRFVDVLVTDEATAKELLTT